MFFTDDIECGIPFHVFTFYFFILFIFFFFFFYKEFLMIFYILTPHGVACRILVPWAEIEPVPFAVKTWVPNHLATRELPDPVLIFLFVSLLLMLKSYLYILNRSLLLDISFMNIFTKSVDCFLILLIFSFTEVLRFD